MMTFVWSHPIHVGHWARLSPWGVTRLIWWLVRHHQNEKTLHPFDRKQGVRDANLSGAAAKEEKD